MSAAKSEIGSYRKINYALRPAKNIERKMMAEACGRLSAYRRVSKYRYVGFGSTFYSDFTLFHRSLGLHPMVSIQRRLGDESRFDFNIPLGCVKNQFGESSEVIPTLKWDGIPTITWLDYDGQLDVSKLDDIAFVVGASCPFSVLAVTVRSEGEDFGYQPEERLPNLKQALGSRMPQDISVADMLSSRFHGVIRKIINATIYDVLGRRNSGLPMGERTQYGQVFYFTYADSTQMVTVGGVFFKQSQQKFFERCDFKSLAFCRPGDQPYNIYAPSLTYREQRHLDRQLPRARLRAAGVPSEDLQAYAELYRYFPHFVEAEL